MQNTRLSRLFWISGVLLVMLLHASLPSEALTVSGTIQTAERWTLADSPIQITGAVIIPQSVTVTIEPGVQVHLAPEAVITVKGQFDARGTTESPVVFSPLTTSRWGAISYDDTGTGILEHCLLHRGSYGEGSRIGVVSVYRNSAPVLIDSCTFTEWPDEFDAKAIQGYHSPRLTVRNCYFGEGANECVHGVNCPAMVEHNTFARRFDYRDAVDIGNTQNPGPIIRYNVFLGSEDDAIDLDTCDALVEGNLVMNCRGGSHDPIGISGDKDSRPLIINNIVYNCENGIAFKNGAKITVLNNTMIDCDRGIWMHQNPAHALVKNTIIWGKENQTSIQLEPGSTIDISYSIIRGNEIYPGTGNLNADPLFLDYANQNFHLLPNSPAIDAGWWGETIPPQDFEGNARVNVRLHPYVGEGAPSIVDIGAFEYIPPITRIPFWQTFEN
ncbi:MAG: right-handed parallel beta-helix repeat-containing protein [bacterium]|nr:right-handed parallel beta-helix repeat-containing protein [bacterium]